MNENVAYVVECSAGQYDDFRWWIGGIFFDQQVAEKVSAEIFANSLMIQQECPPEDDENYYDYERLYRNELELNGPPIVKEYKTDTQL